MLRTKKAQEGRRKQERPTDRQTDRRMKSRFFFSFMEDRLVYPWKTTWNYPISRYVGHAKNFSGFLFILNAVSYNLNSRKIRVHLSQNVKWVVTIAMKFLKERKYFLVVMFSLTSSSLPRKIPIDTDYPTLNPSIPSNRSLTPMCD